MAEMQGTNGTASELVMAVGDSGRQEPTPRSETVRVGAMPTGPDGKVTPATIRWMMAALPEDDGSPREWYEARRPGAPAQLLEVQTSGKPFPVVTWLDDLGRRGSCCLASPDDARDPLFLTLPPADRDRLAALACG
jgi:hypothetical protein